MAPEEYRTIYGDPRLRVEVSESFVAMHCGADNIDMSRAEFREVVLAWERLQEQEDEG
jgi:hypothetical protein